MNDLTNLLNVAIPYIATGVGGYLVVQVKKIIPSAIEYIVTKVGQAKYEKMKTVALDVWKAIDEDCRLGELADTKINTFEAMIKKQFPAITDDTIRLLNKSIAGEVNKGKEALKEAEQQVTVAPTIKYVTPEGTELQPVQPVTTTAANTTPVQ